LSDLTDAFHALERLQERLTLLGEIHALVR
jgi:hypothetical protein